MQRWHLETWRPPRSALWAFQSPIIVVVLSFFGYVCAATDQLFTAKWVKCVYVQWVAPRPQGVHAVEVPLYLQRWHWQGPQWGSWAFQCAAWHVGLQ